MMRKEHKFIYSNTKLRYVCKECGAELYPLKNEFVASREYMADPAIRAQDRTQRRRRQRQRDMTSAGTYLRV